MTGTGALVYVVDDDPSARKGVARVIRSAGMNTRTFASGQEFLATPRPEAPSCLVLDVNLPGLSGLDLQRELAKSGAKIPIIFLTGYGDIPMTVRAVKAGAVDFLTKPFDDEDLLNAIRQCIAFDLKKDIRTDGSFGPIVGTSRALKHILQVAQTVAPTDSTVLLLGETGTGKELIARAVHDGSARRSSAFVKLNCAAIPFDLLESELFGHEKGAFTGAVARRIGRFELADKGTLFLDEVGDMPLGLQPKLLRVLQEQEIERLGSTHTYRVNVRLIAATNQDLAFMVEQNQFREDLYYRLNVFPIQLPPLRERRDDIVPLVQHFVDVFSGRMGKQIEHIPEETLKALESYSWPGNIRELQNVVERAVILCDGETFRVDETWLMPTGPKLTSPSASPIVTLAERESAAIESVLRETEGLVSGPAGAAVKLGIPRQTLQYKIRKFGINRYQFKTS